MAPNFTFAAFFAETLTLYVTQNILLGYFLFNVSSYKNVILLSFRLIFLVIFNFSSLNVINGKNLGILKFAEREKGQLTLV